ncbi:MAG: hypothetical protein ACP5KG_04855 [Myxococcota bacterium]
MEGQKISEGLINTVSGIRRYARTMEYLPEDINIRIRSIEELCNSVEGIIEDMIRKREEELKSGYRDGFEAGKREALNQFQSVILELNKRVQQIKEMEIEQIKSYFKKFVSALVRIISQEDITFLQRYLQELISRIDGEKIKLIVSGRIYPDLNKGILLPDKVELVSDENLSPEQIFLERDGTLVDITLDSFFEEIKID